ncbi:MAG: toxin-antitoxin (TA) system antitoxin [Cyanobacteria bacterium P01_A01_bin.114]
MLTQTFDVQSTVPTLEELLQLIENGTEILITEGDTPLARLVPVDAKPVKRTAGLHSGALTMSDDFDAPLSDKFWLGET